MDNFDVLLTIPRPSAGDSGRPSAGFDSLPGLPCGTQIPAVTFSSAHMVLPTSGLVVTEVTGPNPHPGTDVNTTNSDLVAWWGHVTLRRSAPRRRL